jgi:hypothetical protein
VLKFFSLICPRCGALKGTTNLKNMGTHKLKSSGGNILAGPTEDDADGDEGRRRRRRGVERMGRRRTGI